MLPIWDTLRLVNISAGLSLLQSLLQSPLQGRSYLVEVLICLVSVLVCHLIERGWLTETSILDGIFFIIVLVKVITQTKTATC